MLAIAFLFFPLQRKKLIGKSNADFPSGDPGMYQLDVTLKRGQNLAARDRGGERDVGELRVDWVNFYESVSYN